MKKLFVKTLFVFALAATCQLKAQVTPHTTADYQLSGYPKMAILGDMKELGSVSEQEHQKVVDLLKVNHIENVWLVGEEFGKTQTSYRKFANVDEVKAEIARQRPEGQYILIKGSNGTKLFQLPELL